jgi:PqqD family protein of HPr-rel-A system
VIETEREDNAGSTWRAVPAPDLIWAEVDGQFVAYHRASGKTHFLNAPAAALLRSVLVAPKTAATATEELAAMQGAHTDASFNAAVSQLLGHLEHLGLVEQGHG